ncbi:MAG TPA: aspartate-alanine antiporter [Xanthobacteraceae bacterium]|nr:aspartate-alanine antiporter [Xanthobacteraceae bacterium]
MIDWFVTLLRERPEVTFFATITLGYAIGRLRIGSFTLGAVTGVLLAGVLVGQLGVTLPSALKQVFFLLFLFSIGYRTGPQFFRGLKQDGLAQAALAAVFAFVGLGVAYVAARVLGYQAGTAAGLIAGSLTESATIGTAGDAINQLAIPGDAKARLSNQIPVAFAVTYLVGVIVAAWFLAQLGPRILRVDLAAECRAYEERMSGGERKDQLMIWRMFDVRTFRVEPTSPIAGRPVHEVERLIAGARLHIDRVRRQGEVNKVEPEFILASGDVISVAGRHEIIIEHSSTFGTEVIDQDLVQGAADVVDVVVTNKELDGKELRELAERPFARGIFLRGMTRSGVAIPVTPATAVERGDVLSIVGTPERTKAAIEEIGVADRVTDVTDMVFVGLGIVMGAVVGIPGFRFGALEIGLSESVGVLLGGLIFGWLRSVRPRLGRIPTPTLWLFESLGLTGFVAVVGLSAGPDFVRGLQESGLSLILAAVIVLVSAQFVTLMVGHFFFRMHPGILLGACAGAGTATPALAAVQEVAKSSVPTLGYGVSYAVGNVFLALWGTVIIFLLA